MAKKNEILYVKGMNLSESDGEDSNEDIWDDRKLNDAYDKALRIANAEVAKRVAMSTNTSHQKKEAGPSIKKEKLSNKGKSTRNVKKNQNQTEWKAGMPCRAVYEEDGVEYEAFVLRIINDNECVVRFLGYENSEIVSIRTLKPTLGTEERTRQIEEALDDKTDEVYMRQVPKIEEMECGSGRAPSPQSTDKSQPGRKKSAKKKKNPSTRQNNSFDLPAMPFAMPNISALRSLGAMEMPLPPPPPLPMGDRGRCDSEEQAISSMLLSWYMSGYYTGLYQGTKRAKESRRNL